MYYYRTLTPEQKNEIMDFRRQQHRPWHSPPHWSFEGERQFFISGACFEHAHVIGAGHERMTECENALLEVCGNYASVIYAWCILPNHYHILVKTDRLKELRKEIGMFHGRSSFKWNGEDQRHGRQVWHNCFDRAIKSYRHFWATLNYIHNNPVHHSHVDKWRDWPWSSATDFIERMGREMAERIWREYPILDYGKKWDVDPRSEPEECASKAVEPQPGGNQSIISCGGHNRPT